MPNALQRMRHPARLLRRPFPVLVFPVLVFPVLSSLVPILFRVEPFLHRSLSEAIRHVLIG
jgi:hypothetical protein